MNEERYWQVVLSRDKSMDGEFVYAVRSTGVYCLPSCASRKPHRDGVVFFEGPEAAKAAEAAEFRACLRCHPKGNTEPAPGVALAEQASRYIEENIEGEGALTLAAIGAHVGASQYHLQRVFKRIMGVTPRQYAAALRLERLKSGLKGGESVTAAMYDAGYGSSSRLYESAPMQMGMTPSSYKRGGEGLEIAYTTVDCSLGKLLVAATSRGVCAVSLGDTDDTLLAELRVEYPAACLKRDDEAMRHWLEAVLCGIEERQPYLNLPLDVQGTPFQGRVWQELRAIPYGSTRSYSQVAQALDQPKAVRAVAQACANNRVALVIPCHRVVREDGSLGGYRWGIERKRALLAHEHE